MLTCTKCDTDKQDDEFYKSSARASRNGRTYWCKSCYADNYAANRERQMLSNKRASIKRRYGLTLEEYEDLISKGCSVCGASARGKTVLDHCHVTNSVRAPLCNGCNVALGAVGDEPSILRSLAEYLERHAAA